MIDLDLRSCDRYCLLRSGGSWFALPARVVREVASAPVLTRVPRCDATLAGVCHVRSELLAVVRLDCLLGQTESGDLGQQQMLVITGPQGAWALLVDQVAALESLEPSISQDQTLDGDCPNPVLGTAAYGEQVVRILEPVALYRQAEHALRRDGEADLAASEVGEES